MKIQKSNEPKIFKLQPKIGEDEVIEKLNELLDDEKFAEAIEYAKVQVSFHPHNPLIHFGLGLAYMEEEQPKKAKDVFLKGEKLFPDLSLFPFNVGSAYLLMEEYEKAEKCLFRALEKVDQEDHESISNYLTVLGDVYLETGRMPEAIDTWSEAILEDRENEDAKERLHDYANEFGEPKCHTVFMDAIQYYKKQQIKKYLEHFKKEEFSNEAEHASFEKEFERVWAELTKYDPSSLNKYSTIEKIKLFQKLELDYTKISDKEKFDGIMVSAETKFIKNIFPFLSEEDIAVYNFSFPAFEMAGIPYERFQEIMNGAKYTTEEMKIFMWAVDLVHEIFEAGSNDALDVMEDFYDKALEYIDEENVEELGIEMTGSIVQALSQAGMIGGKQLK